MKAPIRETPEREGVRLVYVHYSDRSTLHELWALIRAADQAIDMMARVLKHANLGRRAR